MNPDSNTSESLGQAKPSDRHTAYSCLASGGQAISVAAFNIGLSILVAVLTPFLLLSSGLLCFSVDGGLLSVQNKSLKSRTRTSHVLDSCSPVFSLTALGLGLGREQRIERPEHLSEGKICRHSSAPRALERSGRRAEQRLGRGSALGTGVREVVFIPGRD